MEKFHITFRHKLPNDIGQVDLITRALKELVAFSQKQTDFKPGDKLNVFIENPKFTNRIASGYECTDHVNRLKDKIAQILISGESINITECIFHIHTLNVPRGSGRSLILNLAKDRKTKQCILEIKNTNNLCCPRAIITGLTYYTNEIFDKTYSTTKIHYIRMGRNLQTELAKELCDRLEEYNEDSFTLEDIKNVENLLNIQVKVICAENLNTIIYQGIENETKIYLYKQGNHFDLIKKMNAFYGSVYFCNKCNTPYNNKNKHTCKEQKISACLLCMNEKHDPDTKSKVLCEYCGRYCFNDKCRFEHGYRVCPYKYRCKKCTYTENYIFFDYEACQETGIHIPNLIVAHDFDGTVHRFNNNDDFCKWLISKEHKKYTAIAHYTRGYDSQFIMQYCLKNMLKPYTIYNGSKLMLLEIPHIKLKIIDSHNFVQAPL